jgi:hypothetical protein
MHKKWLSLCLDWAMLAAIVVLGVGIVTVPLSVHEWLGVALVAALLLHLLLQWPWIASATRQLRAPRTPRIRINYTLNAILFIMVTISLCSGFVISRAVLPALKMHPSSNAVWAQVHALFSGFVLIIIGLHVGMNWHWIKSFVLGLPAKLTSGLRYLRRSSTPVSKPERRPQKLGTRFASAAQRLAVISLAAGVVVIVLYGFVHLTRPRPMVREPDAPVAVAAGAPAMPTSDRRNSPLYPFEALSKQALIIAVSAALGRFVLRLRI